MFRNIQFYCAALCGILSHLCYFIRGEHHLQAPRVLWLYILFFVSLIVIELQICGLKPRHSIATALCNAISCIFFIFASDLIYWSLFHRLHCFSGPKLAKLTKFHHMWKTRSLNQYYYLEELHHTYGDYVRTGPNEITIFTPDAIDQVYGINSACIKAPSWDMIWAVTSPITTRSEVDHASGRKAWEKGFGIPDQRA